VARSATGVVRVTAIPLLIWFSSTVQTTPPWPVAAAAPPYPRGALKPSLATETIQGKSPPWEGWREATAVEQRRGESLPSIHNPPQGRRPLLLPGGDQTAIFLCTLHLAPALLPANLLRR